MTTTPTDLDLTALRRSIERLKGSRPQRGTDPDAKILMTVGEMDALLDRLDTLQAELDRARADEADSTEATRRAAQDAASFGKGFAQIHPDGRAEHLDLRSVYGTPAPPADDIVARLENDVCLFSDLDWQESVALAREAATALRQRDATIAELRAERDKLIGAVGEHVTARGQYHARAEAAEARVKELEAEWDEARADAMTYAGSIGQLDGRLYRANHKSAAAEARAADLQRRLDDALGALGQLAYAEHFYRGAHDRYGDGHIATGRAWDKMRKAGDAARTVLRKERG